MQKQKAKAEEKETDALIRRHGMSEKFCRAGVWQERKEAFIEGPHIRSLPDGAGFEGVTDLDLCFASWPL
ncbi:hypothetical protein OIU85_028966 [Salix viminalis]|uniref:Uncharacterized protein n=1 Tax=Salix viminalis TaxID=40686 RepID=A0A9Q0T6A4_SALVM|nr:hypothetical protein OIU85_028966 [Salix viminalis]